MLRFGAVDVRLPIVVGTRGSPLAIAQTRYVCARLVAAHPMLAEDGALVTETITTSGDRFTDRPLAEIGGKGLFTKEIEEALLDERIDLAVHSMKDVPTWLPEGLEIAAIPEREDPRDVLIARAGLGPAGLAELPQGARVGTGSLRRQAQILARRPDVEIVPMRGNVGTRLRKVSDGAADATLLALAGLKRLGEEIERNGGAGAGGDAAGGRPGRPRHRMPDRATSGYRNCCSPSSIRRRPPPSSASGRCWRCLTAPAACRSRGSPWRTTRAGFASML